MACAACILNSLEAFRGLFQAPRPPKYSWHKPYMPDFASNASHMLKIKKNICSPQQMLLLMLKEPINAKISVSIMRQGLLASGA